MTDLSRAALKQACQALGLDPAPDQLSRLGRYAGLLRDWNQRVNLVSRRDTGRILGYHALDSLAAAPLVPADARVADIGSGAGLPGIPLAICRPDLAVALVESVAKKVRFLEHAAAELGLANVRVCHGRAESLDPLACAVVLSRLTGDLGTCLAWLERHRGPAGTIVLWKSPQAAAEDHRAIERRGLRVVETRDVPLPVSGITRRFIILGPA